MLAQFLTDPETGTAQHCHRRHCSFGSTFPTECSF